MAGASVLAVVLPLAACCTLDYNHMPRMGVQTARAAQRIVQAAERSDDRLQRRVMRQINMETKMQTATIEKIYPSKVWIESDFMGARHVMMQHDAPGEEPFCYATFHYHHHYTCNSMTMKAATKLAVELGATEPVEQRHRPLAV